MIRFARTTLAATVVAAAIGASAPAFAGGSISFTYNPSNPQQAQNLSNGLRLYGLIKGIQNGGIQQNGMNNLAGLAQYGSGNFGLVHQQGNGHQGTITQAGNGNTYGLFQFGQNTSANVNQYGYGQSGATFQFGW